MAIISIAVLTIERVNLFWRVKPPMSCRVRLASCAHQC